MYRLSIVGGLIALIAVVPLSILLTASISFENGIIENFQVILLLGASFLSIRLMFRTSDRAARSFQQFCALMFVLLAALKLAEDYYQLKRDYDELLELLDEKK